MKGARGSAFHDETVIVVSTAENTLLVIFVLSSRLPPH